MSLWKEKGAFLPGSPIVCKKSSMFSRPCISSKPSRGSPFESSICRSTSHYLFLPVIARQTPYPFNCVELQRLSVHPIQHLMLSPCSGTSDTSTCNNTRPWENSLGQILRNSLTLSVSLSTESLGLDSTNIGATKDDPNSLASFCNRSLSGGNVLKDIQSLRIEAASESMPTSLSEFSRPK
jgi:hypothetical protein